MRTVLKPQAGGRRWGGGRRVLAAAVKPIDIRKEGFERFVATAAERSSVLYGLTVVALSVALGWAAGWAARRW